MSSRNSGLAPEQFDRNELKFLRLAYDRHYDLVKHYSSLIFKSRLSAVTLIILVWGYILGVVNSTNDSPSTLHPFLPWFSLPPKAAVAYAAAIVSILLHSMENAYLVRCFSAILSARDLEKLGKLKTYFREYDRTAYGPFLAFRVVNSALFVIYFTRFAIPSILDLHLPLGYAVLLLACLLLIDLVPFVVCLLIHKKQISPLIAEIKKGAEKCEKRV